MSKVPPQLRELLFVLSQCPRTLALRHVPLLSQPRYETSRRADGRTARADTFSSRKILPERLLLYPALVARENLLAASEDVIESIGEMRRRLGELLTDLIDEFFVALLDLLLEELLEGPVAQTFHLFLREIRHQIRDQRPSESTRLGIRIVGQERVDGPRTC